jgi:hypothetical protein
VLEGAGEILLLVLEGDELAENLGAKEDVWLGLASFEVVPLLERCRSRKLTRVCSGKVIQGACRGGGDSLSKEG